MTCSVLEYSDFSNIIALAVGVNLAYFVLRYPQSDHQRSNFLDILGSLAANMTEKMIKKRAKSLASEQKMRIKLDNIISSNKIPTDKKAHFEKIRNFFLSMEDKCKEIFIDYEKKARSRVLNIKNLPQIAIISAFYGLYVMLATPYARYKGVNLNASLLIPNLLFLIFSIKCVIGEFNRWKSFKNPTKRHHRAINGIVGFAHWCCSSSSIKRYIYLILGLTISIFIIFNTDSMLCINEFLSQHPRMATLNYYITILLCFVGFLNYFLYICISNYVYNCLYNKGIKDLKIENNVNALTELLSEDKDILNQAEKEIQSEKINAHSFKYKESK